MAVQPTVAQTQGIPQGYPVDRLLPDYAFTDFRHDFSGDKVNINVLNDIETQGSRATFFKKIEPLLGKDVYETFKGAFQNSLPSTAGPVGPDGKTEEDLLRTQNIPYTLVESVNPSQPVRLSAGTVDASGIIKNYFVTNVVEKPNWDGVPREYINLLSCLWAASRGKVKFAIMYDAGVVGTSKIASMDFRSISELFPTFLPPGSVFSKTTEYEVYFINSSENIRDPAPKITEQTFDKKSIAPNVSVYFLNDYGHHAQYKTYVPGNSDQNSNLYSAYTLTTVRGADNKIRGTITYSDGTSEQVDDVKHESEIGSCSIRALSKFLTSSKPNFGSLDISERSKIMSSFALKRSGDWCQALCLLDKERIYKVSGYESDNKAISGSIIGKDITLQELEDDNVEVMLMTHDRVLLAYAITLGINVCFTNNRSTGHWITYFKNSDIFRIDDYPAIEAEKNVLLENLRIQRAASNTVRQTLTASIQKHDWSNISLIPQLRGMLYILANLIPDEIFNDNINALTSIGSGLVVPASRPPNSADLAWRSFSNTLAKLRNLLPNIKSTLDISARFTKLQTYPEQDSENQTIRNLLLSLQNSSSFKASHKNTEGKVYNLEMAFTLIAERLIDDAQSSNVWPPPPPNDDAIAGITTSLLSSFRAVASRTQITIMRSVYDIFRKTAKKRNVVFAQEGGGGYDPYFVTNAFYLITRLAVPIIYPPAGASVNMYDNIGFPEKGFMRHYDGYNYYVYDNYIVTKEFHPQLAMVINTVIKIYQGALRGDQADIAVFKEIMLKPYFQYIAIRYLIVCLDIVNTKFGALIDEENSEFDRGEFKAGDENSERDDAEDLLARLTTSQYGWIKECLTVFPQPGILPMIGTYFPADPPNVPPIVIHGFSRWMTLLSVQFDTIVPAAPEQPVIEYADLTGLYTTIATLPIPQIGKALYNIEVNPSPFSPPPPVQDYAIIVNDNMAVLKPGIGGVYRGQYLLDLPDGNTYQSVGTGIYVFAFRTPPLPQEQTRLAWGRPGPGGLRIRRPLYSNDQGTHVSRSLHDNNSGLRKRSRTRRTRRVRQSARKSKTR